MALTSAVLKAQLNITSTTDDALLTRLLSAAIYHAEKDLGYALDDEEVLPDGIPGDVEHAVLMLAAHWYENREAVAAGYTLQAVPIGYRDIIANNRTYSFAAPCDEDE